MKKFFLTFAILSPFSVGGLKLIDVLAKQHNLFNGFTIVASLVFSAGISFIIYGFCLPKSDEE